MLRKTLNSLRNGYIRPVLGRFRPGSVAMFHIGRSGSTVLGDMLNQNPKVFWDGEIYHPYVDWGGEKALATGKSTKIDPVQLLRERMVNSGKRFYGFETKFYHLDRTNIQLSDYINGLESLEIRHFIILKRENYLRKIISSSVAFNKRQSNLRDEKGLFYHCLSEKKPELHKIELNTERVDIDGDIKSLLEHLHKYHDNFLHLEAELADKQVLKLSYEDDIARDPLMAYRLVCEFLNVAEHPVDVRFRKTNPFKLSEIVENYSSLKSTLKNTRFEWMTEE